MSERITRLEEDFNILNFLTKEMKGKILHFQSRRDLQAAMDVLAHMDPNDGDIYYFESGVAPDFTINGFLRQNATKKITAVELIPALKILPKIVADTGLLEDFIALAGEVACKERGPAGKELRGIKSEWKELLTEADGQRKKRSRA